jgi:cysteine-rich repeat protein
MKSLAGVNRIEGWGVSGPAMTTRANAALLMVACAACTGTSSDDEIAMRSAVATDVEVLTDGTTFGGDDAGTTGGEASTTGDDGGGTWTTATPVDVGVATSQDGGSTYGSATSVSDGSTYGSATWTSEASTYGTATFTGSATWTSDDTWTTLSDDSTSSASWTGDDGGPTSYGSDDSTGDPPDDDPDPPDDGEEPCEGDECPPGTCGDGATGSDEDCDDGNTDDHDGCSSACEIEDDTACGDGWVAVDEECDDGNEADGGGCASDCTVETVSDCGDGIVSPDEECDDGNEEDDDGCSSICEDEDDDVCVVSDPLPADPEAGARRFCGADTTDLALDGFEMGGCEGDPDDIPQLSCGDPPPQPANAAGGTHHSFIDGETSEWTSSIALKISFSKVPVLSELGAKYEPKFTHKSTVETRIEANFDSGEQPSVFVHDPALPEGAWMYAGTKVSARRAAKTVKTNTLDNKFSMELWVVEGSTTKSDGRFKEIWTSIKYRKGDGPFGAAVKAKEIIGRNDLADDKPVRTSEVVEALRKQMASDEIKAKLVKEHAAALSAAGYVWAEKQIDYGCGLGPDGNGGITEVCIVPWCHYDAIMGRNNFFGHYMESITETTSGLFSRAIEGGAKYVIGNGSGVNPNTQIIAPRNCSRYEIKKDTFLGLWSGYPVWEAGGWGKRGTNETVASPLMATGAKDCGHVGKKCFFTTRTLDAGNHQAVFAWQANQQTDAERKSW